MIAQLFNISNYTPNVYSIPMAVVSAALFVLGLSLLIRERASRMGRALFLMTLAFSEWFFAFTFLYSANNESVALFWAKAGYIGVPCIPASIYLFVVVGLGIYQNWKFVAWFNWAIAVMFSVAILTTDAQIAAVYRYWWGYYPKYGWLSVAFLTYFVITILSCIIQAWVEYWRAAPGTVYRGRITAMSIGLGFASTGIVDFIAKFGIPVYPFAYVSFSVFFIISIWMVRHYTLVEITPTFAANAILDTMSDALFALDREKILRLANKAACSLFSRTERELIGKNAADVIGGDLFALEYEEAIQWEAIQNYEMKFGEGAAGQRTLSLSGSTIRELAKDPVGMLFVARDITELKRQEEELRHINTELRSRQRISEMDMNIAVNLQSQLFPEAPAADGDWETALFFRPASGVSANLYDFYMHDNTLDGISLFNVSGHGISSGLITILAKSIISRRFTEMGDSSLKSIIEHINGDLIAEIGSIENYLTGILLRVNGGLVEYANISHPDLLVKRQKSGRVLNVKPRDTSLAGAVLGKAESDMNYNVYSFSVDGGDLLFLYSSGMNEYRRPDGTRYGDERLLRSLKAAPEGSAREVLDYIMNDFRAFMGADRQADDITAIVLERLA